MKTVFAGLCSLKLALEILNVQVFLDLGLVLLPLQLSHLLAVLVLLARELILHILVVPGRLLNVSRQLLLLFFEALVLVRLFNLISNVALEGRENQISLHLLKHSAHSLNQVVFVLSDLLLVRLYSGLLLQLSAELLGTVFELSGNVLKSEIVIVRHMI